MGKFKGLDDIRIQERIPDEKFSLGNKTDNFHQIKHLHPVFAFDFISLNKGEFCFDGELLGRYDYIKMMKGLRSISEHTYEYMNRENRFHFHEIKWEDVTVKKSDFYKCISRKENSDEEICAYQFKVFEEARIIGFLYKGVFYLVMFDRGHNAYKRKDGKKKN